MKQKELWNKFADHLINEQVTKKRIKKLSSMFNAVLRGIQKPLEKATRKDIEKFVTALNKNEFRKENNQNFSGNSKSDIKKFLKQFYKWNKGKSEFYPKEVAWIKTKISKDEKPEERPILNIEETKKLSNNMFRPEYRILVLLLFDAGFRIQEMLSVKKKNIEWEGFDEDNNKCFWIECNESKTEIRKIPIPLFTDDIKTFCNSSIFESLGEDELLFGSVNYEAFNKNLKKNSQILFGKDKMITPHALRHSSATYYAKEYEGNMNMIAQRYGWSFSSKELKVYIRKSGAYEKAGAKKVFHNELVNIKEENDELKGQMSILNKRMENLKSQSNKNIQVLKEFVEFLNSGLEKIPEKKYSELFPPDKCIDFSNKLTMLDKEIR